MSMVTSQWVPRMLTLEQNASHQQISEDNLDIHRANPENIFSIIITGDETWVHHDDPETKQKSIQWKHKGSLLPSNSVCNNEPERWRQQFFGGTQVFLFWNWCHARQPWLEAPMLPQWWLYARISNRNAMVSCRLVSCYFMTMHPHTSHAHRELL